ncbi:MAG: response regulator [Deltaproteobacteria bacterium]|nr:response regulator [Deltaproteobacteria bacterium]
MLIDLLIIDDLEADFALLVRHLKKQGLEVQARRVETASELISALAEHAPDVVISDYSMPHLTAPQAQAVIKSAGIDVPFIVCSGVIGEEAAVECMRAGAQDFIPKDRLQRLVPAIERELAEAGNRAELRRAEAELRRTAKMNALGQMAAGVSHDLRNLLNPMGLYLRLVERALDRGQFGEVRQQLVDLRTSLVRATEALDRLRDYSRQAPSAPTQEADLNGLVESAITIAHARIYGLSAKTTIERQLTELPKLNVRGSEIVDVFVNLLVNAVEALGPKGGTIWVKSGRVGDDCFVEVTDDGPGIAPEVVSRVFEPFFTTKGAEGTGLGLAMVRACVERHSGRIELETRIGAGSTFRLWFPVATAMPQA